MKLIKGDGEKPKEYKGIDSILCDYQGDPNTPEDMWRGHTKEFSAAPLTIHDLHRFRAKVLGGRHIKSVDNREEDRKELENIFDVKIWDIYGRE